MTVATRAAPTSRVESQPQRPSERHAEKEKPASRTRRRRADDNRPHAIDNPTIKRIPCASARPSVRCAMGRSHDRAPDQIAPSSGTLMASAGYPRTAIAQPRSPPSSGSPRQPEVRRPSLDDGRCRAPSSSDPMRVGVVARNAARANSVGRSSKTSELVMGERTVAATPGT